MGGAVPLGGSFANQPKTAAQLDYQNWGGIEVVDTLDKAKALLDRLRELPGPFGIDTETVVDLDRSPVGNGTVVCWSLAWVEKICPTHNRGFQIARRAFLWADYLELFKAWLEDPTVPKVGHNVFTFDRHQFGNHGIQLQGIVGDTLRMSRFLNADSSAQHGLKSLMERVLNYTPVGEYKEVLGRTAFGPVEDLGAPKCTWRKVEGHRVPTLVGGENQRLYASREIMPLQLVRRDYEWLLPKLYDYASLDAKATLELFFFFKALMKKRPAKGLSGLDNGTMWDLYTGWWNPGLMQLTEYERAGVDLSDDQCAKVVRIIDAELAPVTAKVEAWAPGVNWRSAPQVQAFLYQHKRFKVPPYCGSKLETAKRTKRGKLPGDFVALTYIADQTSTGPADKEGLRAVLRMKALLTDRRFAADLPTYRGPDGRLHTQLAPEADTGRLSSRNPALQQIPKRTALGKQIRKAFVAPVGHALIVADYSQLEMYVAGHYMKALFGDDTLERLLASGDMHSAMALRAWPHELRGLEASQIKEHPVQSVRDRRDHAKAVGYGLFYGKSAVGLGVGIRDERSNPIGTAAAQSILDAYFAAVPALAKVQKFFIEYAREHWGIHTLLGRFRPLAEVNSEDEWERGEGERAALNTPIQGSAHDVVQTAMLRLNTVHLPELVDRGFYHRELASLGAVGILQVHDELQWRVPAANAQRAADIVRAVMESPFKPGVFSLPLKADVHIADTWGDAK